MRKFFTILLFGALIWAIPFATFLLAEPLKQGKVGPYEYLIFLSFIIAVVFFGIIYFKNMFKGFAGEGLLVGILWLAICLVLDWLVKYTQLEFVPYFLNHGFWYTAIPLVTAGFDLIAKRKVW